MARRVFYSFHYQLDSWRVQQVMNMGAVEGQPLLGSQAWEDVAEGGDAAIKKWIDAQMVGKSCNVVLIGSQTAGREWVEYEFKKAWSDKKGVVGIYIHNLSDRNGNIGYKGKNPFSGFTVTDANGRKVQFDTVVSAYDPSGSTSTAVYSTIKNNIERWVEDAISVRSRW